MKKLSLLLALASFVSIAPNLQAAIFNPANEAQLQANLSTAAGNGADDTIILPAGTFNISNNGNTAFTYTSSQDFSLTIVGAGDSTILDGNNADLVMSLQTTAGTGSISVSDLKIQNGNGIAFGSTGGLFIDLDGSGNIAVSDIAVDQNSGHDGAGIKLEAQSGSISLEDSSFTNNSSDNDGGGFYLYNFAGNISVSNVNVTDNQADSTYAGGYIVCFATCSVTNSTFHSNSIPVDGAVGGLAIAGVNATVQLSQLIITDNSSGPSPSNPFGGIFVNVTGTSSITLSNSTITGNQSIGLGGGFSATGDGSVSLSMTGNTISNNLTSDYGGGVFAANLGTVNVSSNYIQGNTAGVGGGIGLNGVGALTFVDNVVTGNESTMDYAGAFILGSSTLNVTNNTIANNTALGNAGGAGVVAADTGTTINIYNNIIYGNVAATSDDIFTASTNDPVFNLFNNDFTEFCLGTDSGLNCDPAVLGSHQGSNIHLDPQFLNAAADDFNIASTSPVINQGSALAPALPGTDILGNARVQGGAPDMGAYEYISTDPDPLGGGGCSFVVHSAKSFPGWSLVLGSLGLLSFSRFRARIQA